MRGPVRDVVGAVRPLALWVLGTLANLLPRRLLREWEGWLPIGGTAIPSALVTIFLGFGLGVPGFLAYATRAASVGNEMMLDAAGRDLAGKLPGGTVTTAAPVSISMLSLFAFSFFTPLGLLSSYLAMTGFLRLAAAFVDEPHGDPILTGLDHARRGLVERVRRDRLAALRERLEGPAVPDLCLRGPAAGEPQADYVIVASRRKPGWEKGVFVVTTDTWYRIGQPYDRRDPGGLRTVYTLTEVGKAEVLRRSVYYELPKVSEGGTGPAGAKAGKQST